MNPNPSPFEDIAILSAQPATKQPGGETIAIAYALSGVVPPGWADDFAHAFQPLLPEERVKDRAMLLHFPAYRVLDAPQLRDIGEKVARAVSAANAAQHERLAAQAREQEACRVEQGQERERLARVEALLRGSLGRSEGEAPATSPSALPFSIGD